MHSPRPWTLFHCYSVWQILLAAQIRMGKKSFQFDECLSFNSLKLTAFDGAMPVWQMNSVETVMRSCEYRTLSNCRVSWCICVCLNDLLMNQLVSQETQSTVYECMNRGEKIGSRVTVCKRETIRVDYAFHERNELFVVLCCVYLCWRVDDDVVWMGICVGVCVCVFVMARERKLQYGVSD